MFEWMIGDLDGKSIIISGKKGSIELKPITWRFITKIPNMLDITDKEEEVVNNLIENIDNLTSNDFELLYCETYETYSKLFDRFDYDEDEDEDDDEEY